MTFSSLKHYCMDLLDLLRNPRTSAPFLPEMADFLRSSPAESLQPSLDYTLLPFLLLVDAAVQCRSSKKIDPQQSITTITISDNVAEGILLCLEELLKKCHLGSVDQMVVVLKKLSYGAMLTPSEAAEEFREGILRCLRALLLRLQLCALKSCTCKKIPTLPSFMFNSNSQDQCIVCSEYSLKPGECLIAFLQSKHASPAVGHWLSLLLHTAEIEAARGHHGSAKLRSEALLTLRVFVAKVGTADALAFFLPGVVSRFAKILHVSKGMVSGAAGSVGSVDHSVRGLTEFLVTVLRDEENLFYLDLSMEEVDGFCAHKDGSTQSILESLRKLPVNDRSLAKMEIDQMTGGLLPKPFPSENAHSRDNAESLAVNRTKDWIHETTSHVDKLLSATFPHLCVHPAARVRLALVDGIKSLMSKCRYTLNKSKLMLLECLCVLAYDDSELVSVAAQESLETLFMLREQYLSENEVAEIFNRLIEKLPKLVLGSEERIVVSHAQKLLAVMYYAGPENVVDHLLRSSLTAVRSLDYLTLSLSPNSLFAGSVDKLITLKPLSSGYLHSISELRAGAHLSCAHSSIVSSAPSSFSLRQCKSLTNHIEILHKDYELPRMPPWLADDSQKLYQSLAGILRHIGLSLLADPRNEISLSTIIDTPLNYLRELISELRMKEYSKESWQSWYARSSSGQVLRQASTAACILNEIIFGISDQSANIYEKLFHKSGNKMKEVNIKGGEAGIVMESVWNVYQRKDARSHVIDCVGSILHEYLSSEIWDLASDQKSFLLAQDMETENLSPHFFRDIANLHQVIIDGIGIFSVSLGNDFISSGFLHSSLYLLLQNLICSNYQIRSASDVVLRVLSASSDFPTVGHLVLANSDYIIDSLCRQLRHLDLNPHVPDVLGSMLSYIGAAHKILPLLEEPMRIVSSELEVLGRHQHPDLIIPFLKVYPHNHFLINAFQIIIGEVFGGACFFFFWVKKKKNVLIVVEDYKNSYSKSGW
ncbi:hypothetical protein QJS04_geneDACA017564 [Acorus gramineus]|uniref:TTI1 N-terminal TPR domain-containing protein n=1 Tax=Acorus gramineus TaxID=55184 RepID=A0AAV9BQV8_ACOGR|nr:hypothetical protein QJS04_geneDACA017564 [Acorus gramineus]